MALTQLSSLATQFVRRTVDAPADPTSDVVEMAFVPVGGGAPAPGDWHLAVWAAGGPPYVAEILVGPNGVLLAIGEYTIWLRITDNPEIPVQPVGTLAISDVAAPTTTFATLEDVAAVAQLDVRDLPPNVEKLLELATGIITSEFPLVAAAETVAPEVRAVCAQMVARSVGNPQGLRQKTIDNFTAVYETGPSTGSGLYITEDERGWLSKWGTSAGTIKITSPYVRELGG